jgi:hypothetical protein
MIDLQAFEPLLGEWTVEAVMPGSEDVLPGSMSVEWLEGGGYLIQRSRMEDPMFPRGISVIGPDRSGEKLVQHYFDSRGVARIYDISLEDGVLRIWRDDPTFAQRFAATLAADAFEGLWQLARTPGDWQDDLKVTYRR